MEKPPSFGRLPQYNLCIKQLEKIRTLGKAENRCHQRATDWRMVQGAVGPAVLLR